MSHCHFASSLTETTFTPGNYVAWILSALAFDNLSEYIFRQHTLDAQVSRKHELWRFKIVYYCVTGVTRDIFHITPYKSWSH